MGTTMAIAAPRLSGSSDSSDCGGDRERLFGRFRDVRTAVQDIGGSLAKVKRALDIVEAGARARELARTVAEVTRSADRNRQPVDELLSSCRGILNDCPRLYDEMGDQVAKIENLWRRFLEALPRNDPNVGVDEATVRASLDESLALISQIEGAVGLLTVQSRLNQHLKTVRVGRRLDFNAMFSDELPDPIQRHEVLVYLKAHPDAIDGEVDAEAGVIYKRSPSAIRRMASPVILLVFAIGGGLVLPKVIADGISGMFEPGWLLGPNISTRDLQTGYWPLLIGSFGHILIGAINEQKRHSSDAFYALDDWFAWVHIREVALLASIFVVWFTLIGLAATLGDPALQPQSAFFAGYSIDSVSGTFINRFDSLAQTTAESLVKRITPGGAVAT